MAPAEYIAETEKEFEKRFSEEVYKFREHLFDERLCKGVPCEVHKTYKTKLLKELEKFLKSRQLGLIDLIKELIPLYKRYSQNSSEDYEKNSILDSEDGWNACRSQFLKNLELKEKK